MGWCFGHKLRFISAASPMLSIVRLMAAWLELGHFDVGGVDIVIFSLEIVKRYQDTVRIGFIHKIMTLVFVDEKRIGGFKKG